MACKNKFLCIGFLLGVVIFPTLTLSASTIGATDQSVVRVVNLDQRSDGLYIQGSGSGVVVDDGFILTNAHVIRGSDKIHVQWKTVSGTVRDEEAIVVKQDGVKDLALIRVSGLSVSSLKISTRLPEKGEPVFAIGFPGVADIGRTVEDINEGLVEATVTQGIVSRLLTRDLPGRTNWPVVQHSAVISGGSSGGALVNVCGELVGLNAATALDETEKGDSVTASGFGFAIQSPAVFQFAKEGGASPRGISDACSVPSNAGTQIALTVPDREWRVSLSLLAFSLGVLVVSGIGAFVVVRRRASRAAHLKASAPLRPKKWDVRRLNSMNQPMSATVIEGVHTKKNPLIIGRDASCNFVMRDPVISRNHVQLFVADGEIWCEDLGSSNGTKLNEVIVKGYPMRILRGGVLTLGNISLSVESNSHGESDDVR
jgi:S1-C subfamily serine protease